MAAAEKAFNAKQWDEVLAKVAEAEAVPVEKSLWDQYWIHEFRGRAYLSQEKYAEAGKELERAGFPLHGRRGQALAHQDAAADRLPAEGIPEGHRAG